MAGYQSWYEDREPPHLGDVLWCVQLRLLLSNRRHDQAKRKVRMESPVCRVPIDHPFACAASAVSHTSCHGSCITSADGNMPHRFC